ncbi:MAG: hypothetical protein B7Y99_03115 [Caulobacterales bacterium 32-69-10]|nr:MAG: hypothetical protein B7Y99_03115 [Caulobacterales bacterium 32-69-10]
MRASRAAAVESPQGAAILGFDTRWFAPESGLWSRGEGPGARAAACKVLDPNSPLGSRDRRLADAAQTAMDLMITEILGWQFLASDAPVWRSPLDQDRVG